MTEEELKQRIKRLEDRLEEEGFPTSDRNCQCCGQLYMPQNYDSVRCDECCVTCYYNRDKKEWVRGRWCPKVQHELRQTLS
jgi:hypothetical protein